MSYVNPNAQCRQPKLDFPTKSLLGIPARLTVAMLDAGWILRNDIIWHKPNCRPEGFKRPDRFSRNHEHVLFFTKSPKYKFNLDSVRAPLKHPAKEAKCKSYKVHPAGKNPGTVWKIPTSAKKGHHATFPAELVRRLILCSTDLGDVVLDPFAGTGTTCRVAEELGRKGYGIELGEY